MKLTLHLLHSDTDYGTEFQIFTSEIALRAAQEQVMRDHRRTPQAALDLLNQPGRADEDFIAAWGAFTDALAERNDYYSIDEQEIEVPLAAIIEAVDAEPELPGEMPDTMWAAICNDRDVAEESLRVAVRQTKSGIADRLRQITTLNPCPFVSIRG